MDPLNTANQPTITDVSNFSINTANQPTVTDVSIFSEGEYYHYVSSTTKDISLKEKVILWTDKYKIQHTSLTALLNILKDEGYDNLPNDGRTLMNTPRLTTIHKKSGVHYYHYGLQNGIIDKLNQLNASKFNNPIVINVNIDDLSVSKSSKKPIMAYFSTNCFQKSWIYRSFYCWRLSRI